MLNKAHENLHGQTEIKPKYKLNLSFISLRITRDSNPNLTSNIEKIHFLQQQKTNIKIYK